MIKKSQTDEDAHSTFNFIPNSRSIPGYRRESIYSPQNSVDILQGRMVRNCIVGRYSTKYYSSTIRVLETIYEYRISYDIGVH